MTPTIETLKNIINEKQLEIQALKNELISEIKNTISFDIDVVVNDFGTYIKTSPNSSRNQFTIYHDYSGVKEKRKYEISWFSSSFNFDDDRYEYSEYLIILGKTTYAMKNGLQDIFETYLNKIQNIVDEIKKINKEVNFEISQNQMNQIQKMIEGNNGIIKMNTIINYIKSKRTQIIYNQIGWIKSKKGYNLYLKSFEDSEGDKVSITESDFIELLMSKFENILKEN